MADDVEIFSGDTLDISVSVTDPSGAAVDLTNGEVLWQVGKSVSAQAPIISKSSLKIGEISLSQNSFVVHVASADTTGMASGNYYHEAQVTLADGRIGTPLMGKFKVKQNLVSPR